MYTKLLELNNIIEGKHPKSIVERLNQGLKATYKHGIAICFDLDTGKYKGLRTVKGNKSVVYMKASGSNGFAPTALQPLSEDPASTVNKLKRAIEALSDLVNTIKPRIKSILNNFDEIAVLGDVKVKLSEMSLIRGESAYLFVASLNESSIMPLYLEKEIQEYMVKNALDEQYGKADTLPSIETGRTCYVCGKTGQKVYGNFSRLKCYNLDKRGMITGGFSYQQPLKNFPVCEDCVTGVSAGFDFALKNLVFPMCGERYILLPNIRTKDDQLAELIVQELQDREATTTGNALEKITSSEREMLEELAVISGGKDVLTLTLVFFEESNASWKITAEIPEILPSRITTIYKAKRMVENNRYLQMGDKPFYYTFKILQRFAGNNGRWSRRKFLDYIDTIFSGGTLEEKTVLTDLVNSILSASKAEPIYLSFTVRDAFATWLFLNQLKILRKGETSMDEELVKSDNPYGRFIKEHRDFFDVHEKIVSFLTGCYVAKVLYTQGANLGNSPFFKKLRGLKLDRKRLQILYPESRNKIQQYDGFGLVKDIDMLLAQAWIDCGNEWKITGDEATLAFTLGLSLDYNVIKAGDKG